MRKYATKLGLISSVLALMTLVGATASALPSVANGHASAAATSQSTQGAQQQAQASQRKALALQKLCQTRQKVITNIMTRIDTRANNQEALFSGIATKVEAFYAKKGNTLSNYTQLVDAVNAAEAQTQTDFATLKTSSSNFTCSVSDPRAIVTGFQTYLKTEISDLQSLRTAVKNLIVGVAQANGLKLANTSTTTTTTGGKN